MDDNVAQAVLHLQNAVSLADQIRGAKDESVSYETMQRSGFRHKGTRPYTLGDAKRHADFLAKELRKAWELLDPSG